MADRNDDQKGCVVPSGHRLVEEGILSKEGKYSLAQIKSAVLERLFKDKEPSGSPHIWLVRDESAAWAKAGGDMAQQMGEALNLSQEDAQSLNHAVLACTRTLIPYFQGVAGIDDFVRTTARFLAEEACPAAKERGLDLCYLAAFQVNPKEFIQEFKDAGYQTTFIGVTADPYESWEGNEAYGEQGNRCVPVEHVVGPCIKHNQFIPEIAANENVDETHVLEWKGGVDGEFSQTDLSNPRIAERGKMRAEAITAHINEMTAQRSVSGGIAPEGDTFHRREGR
ncbi:MAG: zeta toxin family protein [bacterium]